MKSIEIPSSIVFGDIRDIHDALDKYKKIVETIVDPPEMSSRVIQCFNFRYQSTHGSSIYHDAVLYSVFHRIDPLIRFTRTTRLLREALNKHRESVLHFACRIDKSECVRPLLELGLQIDSKDQTASTPMHLAIQNRSTKCIHLFEELLRSNNTDNNNNNYRAQLKNALIVYNNKGHTPLHLAVLHNYPDLVEGIIKFCRTENSMHICSMETLGNGERITHLAEEKSLGNILETIFQEIPESKFYKNYSGLTSEQLNAGSKRRRKSKTRRQKSLSL